MLNTDIFFVVFLEPIFVQVPTTLNTTEHMKISHSDGPKMEEYTKSVNDKDTISITELQNEHFSESRRPSGSLSDIIPDWPTLKPFKIPTAKKVKFKKYLAKRFCA